MFQNGYSSLPINSFTFHSGSYMGDGFSRRFSRSKELTPLYSEVLGIVKSTKKGGVEFCDIANLVTCTIHDSRVRLALEALVEMDLIVDVYGLYFIKETDLTS